MDHNQTKPEEPEVNSVVGKGGRKINWKVREDPTIYIRGKVRGGKREEEWRMGRKHVEERTRVRI